MRNRTGRETAYEARTIDRLADLYEAVDPEGLIDHPHPISRTARVADETAPAPALATIPG